MKKKALVFAAVFVVFGIVFFTFSGDETEKGAATTTTTVIRPPEPIMLDEGECYLAYRDAVDLFNESINLGLRIEDGIFNDGLILDNAKGAIAVISQACDTQLEDGLTQFLVEANRLAVEATSASPINSAFMSIGLLCRTVPVTTNTINLICFEATRAEAEFVRRLPVDGFLYGDETGFVLPEGHLGSDGM
jgi:hypothetical protein